MGIGRKAQPPGYRFVTNGYDHVQVIYVQEGTLYFRADKYMRLGRGGLALLRIGGAFTLWTESCGYKGIYFGVTGANDPDFSGPANAFKSNLVLRTLAELIEREVVKPAKNSEPLLKNLGWALLWNAIRQSESGSIPRSDPRYAGNIVAAARQALEMSAYTGQSARDVLGGMDMSYWQLTRHFTSELRLTPKQYQLQIRIDEARRLLASSSMNVTEIAYELGFSSSQHFSSQFRDCMGVSPLTYRENLKTRGQTDGTHP